MSSFPIKTVERSNAIFAAAADAANRSAGSWLNPVKCHPAVRGLTAAILPELLDSAND